MSWRHERENAGERRIEWLEEEKGGKRGERKKDRAITPPCTRLILIYILIAATIIDGSDFSGKPRQFMGRKKESAGVEANFLRAPRPRRPLQRRSMRTWWRELWTGKVLNRRNMANRGKGITFDRRYDFMRSFCTAAIKFHN